MNEHLVCPQLSAEGRNLRTFTYAYVDTYVTCTMCDTENNNICPAGPQHLNTAEQACSPVKMTMCDQEYWL